MSDEERKTVYIRSDSGVIQEVDVATGEILASEGSDLAGMMYSEKLCDLICQRIAKGDRLAEICGERDMPHFTTVYRWMKEHNDFRESYLFAKKARAEYYADKVISEAENAQGKTKDEAPLIKMLLDAYKWGAQVGNPGEYAPQKKISGDIDNPVRFIIETGIRREEIGESQIKTVESAGAEIIEISEGKKDGITNNSS